MPDDAIEGEHPPSEDPQHQIDQPFSRLQGRVAAEDKTGQGQGQPVTLGDEVVNEQIEHQDGDHDLYKGHRLGQQEGAKPQHEPYQAGQLQA